MEKRDFVLHQYWHAGKVRENSGNKRRTAGFYHNLFKILQIFTFNDNKLYEKHGSNYLCQKTCLHRSFCHCLDTRVPFNVLRNFSQTNCPFCWFPWMSDIHNIFSIKITPTRITDSTFYFVIFIVGHNSLSVCLVWVSSIVRRISHRPTVRVVNFLKCHIYITSSASEYFRANHRLYFLCFRFVMSIVGHNSLSVCLYGY